MKMIYMEGRNQTKIVLVDDDDYEKFNRHKWCASSSGKNFYAMRATRKGGKYKAIYMHREILPPLKEDEEIDHINRNTLDNRKANLRRVSRRENALNRIVSTKTSLKYKGVAWHDAKGKFIAYFRNQYIGYFDNEEDAALAHNAVAFAQEGEYPALNIVPGVPKHKLTIMPRSHNSNAPRKNRYRGVRRKSYNCFEAYIQYDKKRYVIGYSKTEREAAKLYNAECHRLKLFKRKNKI